VDGSWRTGSNGPLNVLVLKHVKGRTNEKSKDVTTLDWNVSFITLFCFNCYSPSDSKFTVWLYHC